MRGKTWTIFHNPAAAAQCGVHIKGWRDMYLSRRLMFQEQDMPLVIPPLLSWDGQLFGSDQNRIAHSSDGMDQLESARTVELAFLADRIVAVRVKAV